MAAPMAHGYYNPSAKRAHGGGVGAEVEAGLSGRVVDIGCGVKPYEAMLRPHVAQHVGVDHPGSLHGNDRIDAAAIAYALPFAPDSFDGAICTSVLEHLEEPAAALREAFRVLRPGATAIYSTPFLWHLHEEPRDFYRYTPHGLQHLFTQAGFEVVAIRPLSGFWGTFGQLLAYNFRRLMRKGSPVWALLAVPILAAQAIGWALDRVDPAPKWPYLYLTIARKPFSA